MQDFLKVALKAGSWQTTPKPFLEIGGEWRSSSAYCVTTTASWQRGSACAYTYNIDSGYTYTFRVTASDKAGNTSQAEDSTYAPLKRCDLVLPVQR